MSDINWVKGIPLPNSFVMLKITTEKGIIIDPEKLIKFKTFIHPEAGDARYDMLDIGSDNPTLCTDV